MRAHLKVRRKRRAKTEDRYVNFKLELLFVMRKLLVVDLSSHSVLHFRQ